MKRNKHTVILNIIFNNYDYKELRKFALDTERQIAPAIRYLVRQGIRRYKDRIAKDVEGQEYER